MSLRRIWSIFLQEVYITKRSLEIVMDLFFFSLFAVLVFGFISIFLSGQASAETSQIVILGLLLWEIIRMTQYTVSVSSMWNVWSRNLTNLFIAPISCVEYMTAHLVSAALKTVVLFAFISVVANWQFHFNVLTIGAANLILIFLNLIIFAWSLGLVLLGFIFRYGTRVQALAWGVVFVFQPFAAAFFPVSVMPPVLQAIAYTIPATYFFESGRYGLSTGTGDWKLIVIGSILNIIYFGLAIMAFAKLFSGAKRTGQFARNET